MLGFPRRRPRAAPLRSRWTPRRDRRSALVQPGRPARRGRQRQPAAAAASLDRAPHHRVLLHGNALHLATEMVIRLSGGLATHKHLWLKALEHRSLRDHEGLKMRPNALTFNHDVARRLPPAVLDKQIDKCIGYLLMLCRHGQVTCADAGADLLRAGGAAGWASLHGYAIIKRAEEMSNGQGPSHHRDSLYGAGPADGRGLRVRLVSEEVVDQTGRIRRSYGLTDDGAAALSAGRRGEWPEAAQLVTVEVSPRTRLGSAAGRETTHGN